MTCIAAAIINNKAIMAADTLVSDPDGSKSHPRNFSKIVEFNHFIVGFAGDCMAYHVLYKMSSGIEHRNRKLKTVQEVFNFSKKFYKEMKEAEDTELLIINRQGKIYKVCNSFVEECGNIASIGAGKDLAVGYMRGSDSADRVLESVELACELNNGCEGPVHVKEMLIDN